jgi:hypothetical protein
MIKITLIIFFAILGWSLFPGFLSFACYFLSSWFIISFFRKINYNLTIFITILLNGIWII